MKKLLAIFGAVFLSGSTTATMLIPKIVTSKKRIVPKEDQDENNWKESAPPKISKDTQKDIILNRLTQYSNSEILTLNISGNKEIDAKMVVEKIKTKLWEFANDLKFEVKKFQNINLEQKNNVEGKIDLTIIFNDEKLINPKTNTSTFSFSFTLDNLKNIWTVEKYLQNNPLEKLSSLGINLGGEWSSF